MYILLLHPHCVFIHFVLSWFMHVCNDYCCYLQLHSVEFYGDISGKATPIFGCVFTLHHFSLYHACTCLL